MSTIWFCGDTHGKLDHLQKAWDRYGPVDAVVHLGDFGLDRPLSDVLSKAVAEVFWWIPGNHDFDQKSYRDHLYADPLANRCLHAQVRRVADVRLAGLGGNFQGKVWRPPDPPAQVHPWRDRKRIQKRVQEQDEPIDLKAQGAIWPDQVAFLSKQRASILVSHEAPSSHRHGFAVLDELGSNLGASLIVHGHHHQDLESTVADGRIRVLGVGLRGITDRTGNCIVPGEKSTRRQNELG